MENRGRGKSETGCLFSKSCRSRNATSLSPFYAFLLLLCQFTRSPVRLLSHTLKTHIQAPSPAFPPLICSLFEQGCLFSSLLNHIFCHAASLREEPVELDRLPSLRLSVLLCLRLSAITPSSLRWPVIADSSA